jgi:hypothetical protein
MYLITGPFENEGRRKNGEGGRRKKEKTNAVRRVGNSHI